MAILLRELAIGAVPHGFRSSFRDWAAECTDAPREVCELPLARQQQRSRGSSLPAQRPVRPRSLQATVRPPICPASARVARCPQDQRSPPARQLCALSGASTPCRRTRTRRLLSCRRRSPVPAPTDPRRTPRFFRCRPHRARLQTARPPSRPSAERQPKSCRTSVAPHRRPPAEPAEGAP